MRRLRNLSLLLALIHTCCFFSLPATSSIGDPSGTNFPMDAEGRTYHLGLKKGEVANRILLVGDPDRAKIIFSLLDHPQETFYYSSNRGFTTYTGTKEGVPVTIMAIGMGIPMMDFAIREIRAITEGPLAIIRLGSCGTPRSDIRIGTIVAASSSFGILTDYDAYHRESTTQDYFTITKPIQADSSLHEQLVNALKEVSNNTFPIEEATDATADSFYGSQGRIDPSFDDRNQGLIDQILACYPDTGSLQMETYHLYHLAKLNEYAVQQRLIRAAGCAMVLANRKSDEFLTNDLKHALELKSGDACLKALIRQEL